MKIISINIAGRSNFGKDYKTRMQSIADFLDKEKADIVCMQEVTFSKSSCTAETINNSMTSPYPFVYAHMSEKYTFDKFAEPFMKKWKAGLIEHDGDYATDGVAILSKEPMSSDVAIVMKPAPADERGKPDLRVRVSQIIKKKEGFSLANVHFATNYNAYMQLEELLEYCSPDIIVGDFNMFTEDIKEHKYIWSPNYNASIEFKDYISFPNENATFDHMLLKPSFKFTSIKTVEGMSDHSAIIYTIEKE